MKNLKMLSVLFISSVAIAQTTYRTDSFGNTYSTDDAESYSQYMYNLRKGSPNAYRAEKLEEAALRNAEILGRREGEDNMLRQSIINSNLSQDEIDYQLSQFDYLNNLSGEERLENYIKGKQGSPDYVKDPRFEQDLSTMSSTQARVIYGDAVADYIYKRNRENYTRSLR